MADVTVVISARTLDERLSGEHRAAAGHADRRHRAGPRPAAGRPGGDAGAASSPIVSSARPRSRRPGRGRIASRRRRDELEQDLAEKPAELTGMAATQVEAHLIRLAENGEAARDGESWRARSARITARTPAPAARGGRATVRSCPRARSGRRFLKTDGQRQDTTRYMLARSRYAPNRDRVPADCSGPRAGASGPGNGRQRMTSIDHGHRRCCPSAGRAWRVPIGESRSNENRRSAVPKAAFA